MKTNNLLKSVLVIICLLLQFNLLAQAPPITIHVEAAGTLPTLIDENQKYEITDLTLTGNLNSTDILFIREMAGMGNGWYGKTNGQLANLDLSGANIVSGGNYYFYDDWYENYYYTENNQISPFMFFLCSELKTIILPNSVTSIGQAAFGDCTNLTSVTISNGVTLIGQQAFAVCTGLTSVTIPDSVTEIGSYAFAYCTGLTSITIGSGVTSIGSYAFGECTGLTCVTIPDNVTSIGFAAFGNCTGLASVTIGNSVALIGDAAFGNCTTLQKIIVSEKNPNYTVLDDVLFNKDKTTLVVYPSGKSGDVYSVTNSVTSIGNYAFYNCTKLTSITIPESVTSIGEAAFESCTGLTGITIPESLASIRNSTFRSCTSLISVTIPNNVTSIGSTAFEDCTGLTSVTIGNSVTSIGDYAFYNCTGLTSITIPDSVTWIGRGAFANCTGLTEIFCKNSIPPTLSHWEDCFSNVNKTTCKLYVPKGSKSAYQSAPIWQDFRNIIEESVSINTIDTDNTRIQSISNGIAIETKEATPISVYTLSGQQVYQSVVIGNVEIALDKGVYILKVNSESQKVMVK